MSLYKKYLATIKKWIWKDAQYDAYYNNMCVDWAKMYAKDLWYPITTYWNAKDFATKWLWPNWQRVKWEPWVWDIIVQPRWEYWHIAVFQRKTWYKIFVVEQNRDWKASSTTKWSPVALWEYLIRWDEVYFRAK